MIKGDIIIDNLTTVGNSVFFSANDDINGKALWKSDGTESGTVPVKELGLSTNNFTESNGLLLFSQVTDYAPYYTQDLDLGSLEGV